MCVRSGCRDARMEMQFQRKWALRKRVQDRAVLVFFILSALLLEAGGLFYAYPHEASPSPCSSRLLSKAETSISKSVQVVRCSELVFGALHQLLKQEGIVTVSGKRSNSDNLWRLCIQVHCMLPGLIGVVVTVAMLGAMLLRPAWYLEQRSGLQLLLRICRWATAIQDPGAGRRTHELFQPAQHQAVSSD